MGGLRDTITRLLKQGYKKFVLNLSGLKYLDSSGVGELVRNYMSVIKAGGEMRVVGLTARVEEIMKVTQLHQVFEDFRDEASALGSFLGVHKHGGLQIVEDRKKSHSSDKRDV